MSISEHTVYLTDEEYEMFERVAYMCKRIHNSEFAGDELKAKAKAAEDAVNIMCYISAEEK